MHGTSSVQSETGRRIIRLWLWIIAGLIFAMVVVGGATRLTRSGLSIVEWNPVIGVVPPLNQDSWQAEFKKYQAIPQYQKINRGMNLGQFKIIYWWEWTHRLLGRVIGAAFLLPLLWFLWKGWMEIAFLGRLWLIFGVGALQGVVGWWMVTSGLMDRVEVSQYRLAFHLTLACALFAAIIWTAQRTLRPGSYTSIAREGRAGPSLARLRATAALIPVLVLCQIYLGALVAGLHAGLIYNTWPLIDGSFIPRVSQLLFQEPWWRNLFENTLTVQFVHRTVAYVLWTVALAHAIDAARTAKPAAVSAILLAAAVTLQAALGIVMLLHQAPIGLALLHQAVAVAVLAIAVVHAARVCAGRISAALPQSLASQQAGGS
ncbi:MAG TPA: COX15/CtaA family protein [Xanthobacteraceae bacterium]|jgi:cytochrome c oxidase assembly protein subunit 15